MEPEFEKLLTASKAFTDDRKAVLRDIFPHMEKKTQKIIMKSLKEEVIEREKIRNERDGKLLNILEKQNGQRRI